MRSPTLATAIAGVFLVVLGASWLALERSGVSEAVALEREGPRTAALSDVVHETSQRRTAIATLGRVAGTVADSAGTPLGGGAIRLQLVGPADRTILAQPADDGSFEVRGLERGTWAITCTAPRRFPEAKHVTIADVDAPERADFVLLAARELAVRVVAADGSPLSPALELEGLHAAHVGTVVIHQDGRTALALAAQACLGTEGRGVTIVERTPVRAQLLLGNALLDETLVDEDASEVVLHADVARIRSQAAWIEVEVPASHAGGTAIRVENAGAATRHEQVEPGEFIARIPVAPGSYEVEIAPAGSAWSRRELHVAPGATARIALGTLSPECILRGRVVDAEGRGLAAPVVVSSRRPTMKAHGDRDWRTPEREVNADANGHFIVRGLAAGEWIVECEWPPRISGAEGPHRLVTLPDAGQVLLRGAAPEVSGRAGSALRIR